MTLLKKVFAAAFLIIIFSSFSFAVQKEGYQVKQQPELQQVKPKKPVKIKLRRTAKDEYIWDLSGDDADEIIKTDRRLRKMLNIK